jgi:hypothetical protein
MGDTRGSEAPFVIHDAPESARLKGRFLVGSIPSWLSIFAADIHTLINRFDALEYFRAQVRLLAEQKRSFRIDLLPLKPRRWKRSEKIAVLAVIHDE